MRLDLITAFRQLRQAPGTALATILTLAVGIGATTAVFSFVVAVLSAASPAPDMDRLVAIWARNRTEAETKTLVSAADYLEWRARARSFESIAAWRNATFTVTGAGAAAARDNAQLVSPEYFRVFGWQPARGRAFTAADAEPGAPGVVILSHSYWESRFGGNAEVIGKTLHLDREPVTVVGVLPPIPGLSSFFVPLAADEEARDSYARTLFVFARLRPGMTFDFARAEMESIGDALASEWPNTHRGWTANVTPLQEEFVGPQARVIFALLVAIVTTVLIIGCVNIANLLLARGMARRGEMAVRLALGAGSWRLTRQLLVECGVLAASGGVLSLLVSRWTLQFLGSLGDIDSPWLASGINLRVLALTAIVATVATLAAGLAPALAARRANLVDDARGAARSNVAGTRVLTRVLVGAQVALAVALLVITGLALRTLIALESLDPGFDIDNVLTASVTLSGKAEADAAERWAQDVLTEVRRTPGVVSAGATTRLPFAGSRWNPNRGIVIEGQSLTDGVEGRWAIDYAITPGFLESLRVPVRDGRMFTEGDGKGAPLVAVVSETMARRFWGNRSPLGARLRQGDEPAGEWRTVVGVVGDIRNDDADQPPVPYLYMPLAQHPSQAMTLAIRTSSDPLTFVEPLRRAVATIDPDEALYDVRTMRQVWESDLRQTRVLITAMNALALIALALAGIGVWGVAAQSVGQRTREIGVRVALGATARQVGGLIARQGLTPIVAGLVIGLAAGLGVAQLMRSILFQVSPTDPVTVAVTLGLLFAVGVLATIGPALRAARLDPLSALRE